MNWKGFARKLVLRNMCSVTVRLEELRGITKDRQTSALAEIRTEHLQNEDLKRRYD
jgi:hypothetical protein